MGLVFGFGLNGLDQFLKHRGEASGLFNEPVRVWEGIFVEARHDALPDEELRPEFSAGTLANAEKSNEVAFSSLCNVGRNRHSCSLHLPRQVVGFGFVSGDKEIDRQPTATFPHLQVFKCLQCHDKRLVLCPPPRSDRSIGKPNTENEQTVTP